VANYNKDSMPILRIDAQFTAIESALKGYVKWKQHAPRTSEAVCIRI